MVNFGIEEYGNKDSFGIRCRKCGSTEAKIVPLHYFADGDYIHPAKSILELRCTCGNKFGIKINNREIPQLADYDESKGFTVTYVRDDDEIRYVAARCISIKELHEFLNEINTSISGWSEDELESLEIVNDIRYIISP